MSDYQSKYTGNQVEALLDIVSQGGTGGGGEGGEVQKTTEAEIAAMGFTKNLGTITEVKMNGASKGTSGVVDLGNVITAHQDISGKVDKVTGKGLSTEDFTSALKSKLEGLTNYDDTAISNAVSSLQSQINTLVSGNANDAINSFNEIIAFLEGVKDTEDLEGIIASIEQQIAGVKKDMTTLKIDISGIGEIEEDTLTDVTALVQSSTGMTMAEVYNEVTSGRYVDLLFSYFLGGWMHEVTRVEINSETFGVSYNYEDATNGSVYMALMFSKDTCMFAYTLVTASLIQSLGEALEAKQDIIEDIDTIRSGAALGATALQSYTEQYKGTITGIKMNGASKGTSGVVDLGNVITAHQDISGKQDKLVSGSNIKTINGQSILGSGNITIEGGGGSSSGSQKELVAVQASNGALAFNEYRQLLFEPNKIYYCTNAIMESVSIMNVTPPTSDVGEYSLHFFTEADSRITLDIPSDWLWANGVIPTIECGIPYELSVVATKQGNSFVYKAVLTPFKSL